MLRALDLTLFRALRGHGHSPVVERLVLGYTRIGEHGVLWQCVCALAAVGDRRRRPLYLQTMRTVMLAYLMNIVLKHVIRRRRPRLEGLPPLSSTVSRLSFPSAHSTTSFAAARSLARAGLPLGPLYAAAVAMAASRVYAGVHYPTDVVAGAVLGSAVAGMEAGR